MARKKEPPKKLNEARALYDAQPAAEPDWIPLMDSRLSSKNQITIPMRMTRALDWQPGDEIGLMVHGDMIMLSRVPKTSKEWRDHLRGSVDNPEWGSKEAIDAWVRKERDSWDREWDRD
jgi:bifunctional DNA-binding transcriptional regulator/antitoxin component of YhaV-PrlF toxin-antitoxin module